MKRVDSRRDRGSALALVLLIIMLIAGLVAMYLVMTSANEKSTWKETMGTQAMYTAEAAATIGVSMMNMPPISFDWNAICAAGHPAAGYYEARGIPDPGPPNPLPNPTYLGVIDRFSGNAIMVGAMTAPWDASQRMAGRLGSCSWEMTIVCAGYDGQDNDSLNGVDDAGEMEFATITARAWVTDPGNPLNPDPTTQQQARQIEVTVGKLATSAFTNALAAWNEDGDPNYTLFLTSHASGDDIINGSVYVNGSLDVSGNADITGSSQITPMTPPGPDVNTVSDTSPVWNGNYTTGSQTAPPWPNYDDPADPLYGTAATFDPTTNPNGLVIDVDARLDPLQNLDPLLGQGSCPLDGTPTNMRTMNANDPAHIFQKMASTDARVANFATAHPGGAGSWPMYNLGDPTTPGGNDPDWDGNNGEIDTHQLDVRNNGHKKVYRIGDSANPAVLALNWQSTFSVALKQVDAATRGDGIGGTQITLVVYGACWWGDNLFKSTGTYNTVDGIAIIIKECDAAADPDGQSGNMYYGDGLFGTTEMTEAWVFAENDFIIENVSNSSATNFTGSMSCGGMIDAVSGTVFNVTYAPPPTGMPGMPDGSSTGPNSPYGAAAWTIKLITKYPKFVAFGPDYPLGEQH